MRAEHLVGRILGALSSREVIVGLIVCWLVCIPLPALSEPAAIRIGLNTLTGRWTVKGPASIKLHKADLTLEIVEIPADGYALVSERPGCYCLASGSCQLQAELIAVLLRGCGFYTTIRREGTSYLVDLLIDGQEALWLSSRGIPLAGTPDDGCYGGLQVLVNNLSVAVLSAEVSGPQVVKINQNTYPGVIRFAFFSPVKPSAVATLELERYLQGVVPVEMPSSWPLPALQAQAVAARTYALKQIGRHLQDGYDLCDTSHCQAYGGSDAENERSNQAVLSTAGMVMAWRGRLIDAVYHSHAGGHTVSSQSAWGSKVDYLVAQPIPEEPPYIWSLQITAAELEERLRQLLKIGYIYGLHVAEYGEGRRVVTVVLDGLLGPGQLPARDLRLALGVNRLRSSCFTVTACSVDGETITPRSEVTLLRQSQLSAHHFDVAAVGGCFAGMLPEKPHFFIFSGTGYGHGVGMSQWGAFGLANLGYSYKEILCRFYQGAELAGYR